jgi:membrane-bound ClpP family serine protease
VTGQPHDLEQRARDAAAGLRRAVAPEPPELPSLVRAARVRRVVRLALVMATLVLLGAVASALASATTPADLRWATGAVLLALLGLTWLACAHAGGHVWLVPLPALVLAGLWALTVSAHDGGWAWWLVALTAVMAAAGVVVAGSAVRQQLRGRGATASLTGTSGAAVTPLDPVGVVQVAGETWTARSLSGRLPAGAPVHVVRARGVRLEVWSETGTVPDGRDLDLHADRLVERNQRNDRELP